ncbi:MAG: hypothetical protein HY966_04600 [Ignavibacteriales bacterium]|nr:hypothetical protein [Ignavibacteriales bacterium]
MFHIPIDPLRHWRETILLSAFVLIILAGVFLLIRHREVRWENRWLWGQSSAVIDTPGAPHREPDIVQEERRIADRFLSDTLPNFMRSGFVVRFVQAEAGTILYVRSKFWAARTASFKREFLMQAVLYNKYYRPSLYASVRDHDSQRLLAEAFSIRDIRIYS